MASKQSESSETTSIGGQGGWGLKKGVSNQRPPKRAQGEEGKKSEQEGRMYGSGKKECDCVSVVRECECKCGMGREKKGKRETTKNEQEPDGEQWE